MNVRKLGGELSIAGLVSLVMGCVASDPKFPSALRGPAGAIPAPGKYAEADVPATARLSFGQIPLGFEANQGQTGADTHFLARGRGYSMFLTGAGPVLALRKSPAHPATKEDEHARAIDHILLRLKLVGANPAPLVAGLEEGTGKVNYFIGNDPTKWRTNVPTYGKVKYEAVYPGVDLVYYGNQQQLEYDFVVAPGADPRAITLDFEGTEKLRVKLSADGSLLLRTTGGELRLRKPSIYQETNGARREVSGGYVLRGKHQVGFQVGPYEATKPLIIDPVLLYSTYLGGGGEDNSSGVVVDSTGIYLAGLTVSTNFPTAGPPYQSTNGGDYDAFVTKLNPSGSALIYSTYLGGNSTDYGLGLAVDASGNAYITGLTASTNFPTAGPPYQSTNGGGLDAFVTKLNSTGSALLYSTYLGGSNSDFAIGIAVDASGNAYVTGRTDSTNFPTAGTPFQSTSGGGIDAFVAKLNPSASGAPSLVYSTYLGGSGEDRANGIVADASGNAYVTGRTASTNFPLAGTPYQSTNGGNFDVFVTKLNPTGSALLYSTYLGGSGDDRGFSIARDSSNNVYVTGRTRSTNFPTTPGAFQPTHGSGLCGSPPELCLDAFVAKLNPAAPGGASLVYSTFLGGNRDDEGEGIAVDGSGNASVTGYTDSTDFPTANAFQPVCGMGCGTGFVDVFVTKLNPTGSSLVFSTYLGGSSSDYGIAVFVDGSGNVYVSGETFSNNFPTVNPYNGNWGGDYDAFVAKIDNAATSADLAVSKTATPNPVIVGNALTYTVTVTNNGPNAATGVRLTDRMPAAGLTVVSFMATQGTCTVVSGFFHELRCDLGLLASAASATATIVVTPTLAGTITNTARVASNVSDPNGANNAVTRDTTVVSPRPTVTAINPNSGTTAGGTPVTITGTNFQAGAAVSIGGVAATGVTVVNSTTITATTGAHAAGVVDVVVTNPDAQSGTLPAGFTYSTGAAFFTVTPCRLVDTRNPPGPSGGPALSANSGRTFPVSGLCSIPSTAKAVALIVVAVAPSDSGDIRLYPAGGSAPVTSAINFRLGLTRANNAVIPLGTSGQISAFCDMPVGSTGSTHFVIDAYGYFQ